MINPGQGWWRDTSVTVTVCSVTDTFAKIYATILDSSIWLESEATRLVWLTMLVMADAEGVVVASVGGLAHRARVSREACEQALATLSSPDPDDKSGVMDGIRIVRRPENGGWFVVNHAKYREKRTPKQVADAERQRRSRNRRAAQRQAVTCHDVTDASRSSQGVATEADMLLGALSARTESAKVLPPAGSPLAAASAALPLSGETNQGDPPDPSLSAPDLKAEKPTRSGSRARAKQPARWRFVPGDWAPAECHRAQAARLGVDLETEAEKFRAHEFAKPKTDADKAFTTWLGNAASWGAKTRQWGSQRPGRGVQPSDMDYAQRRIREAEQQAAAKAALDEMGDVPF